MSLIFLNLKKCLTFTYQAHVHYFMPWIIFLSYIMFSNNLLIFILIRDGPDIRLFSVSIIRPDINFTILFIPNFYTNFKLIIQVKFLQTNYTKPRYFSILYIHVPGVGTFHRKTFHRHTFHR